MGNNEDILLPEEIEGKGVTVEDSEEKTEEEKKRFEKQKQFEYQSKHAEPEELARRQEEDSKKNLMKWILIGVVAVGVIVLGILLL